MERAAAAERPPYRTTRFDREIFLHLLHYRFLATDQIAALCYPEEQSPSRSQIVHLQRRLRRSFDHGLTDRQELAVRPSQEGRKSLLHALRVEGVEDLLEQDLISIDDLEALGWHVDANPLRGGSQHLKHQMAINWFRIYVVNALEQRGWPLAERWIDDVQTHQRPLGPVDYAGPRGGQKQGMLIPDAMFSFMDSDSYLSPFCLELDRRTVRLRSQKADRRSMDRKFRIYAAALADGQLFRHYGVESMRLLFVTTGGEVRRRHLQAYCEEAVPAALQPYFWFACLRALSPQTVLTAPVWTVAGSANERRGLPDLDGM